jgi:PAS domain S-box-containing protein
LDLKGMGVKQDVAYLSREELEAEVVALRALADRMERNRRREAIFESAVDFAIVATDCQGVITDWNGAAERIMGWTALEMVGNTADTFFTPEDRAQGRVAREMELSLQDGSANDERWHLRKDGTRFWASGEMFALRDELNVHQGFVKILRDRTEQRAAGEKLLRSEERMRTVLEAVDTAFAIVEVKFEADRRPVDYRFVEANPAFERQAGVNLRGKWVTEFAPDLERFWFETYGHVARTGEPANFESYAKAFGRWFDVRALRVGDPSARQIAIFFNDVTARRELEARNAATQQLSDSLRSLSDPDDIAATAARILGTTLQASVVGYGAVELDEGAILVKRDWTADGIQSLPKPIHVHRYGAYWENLMGGQVVAISDVERDPRTAAAADELAVLGGRAFVNIPVMHNERLVAILYVGQAETRTWSQSEIVFLRDVANRIQIEMERVRSERDLRASEARVQDYADRVKLALAAGAIIGTWVWDLREDKFTVDEAFANAFGLDPALGREGIPLAQIVETVHPDD